MKRDGDHLPTIWVRAEAYSGHTYFQYCSLWRCFKVQPLTNGSTRMDASLPDSVLYCYRLQLCIHSRTAAGLASGEGIASSSTAQLTFQSSERSV